MLFSEKRQKATGMCSFKTMFILCAMIAVCYGESRDKKHKHKYHHLYWHGLHYLTFLALKLKVILVLGSIFTIGMVAGKIFAVLKFAEYMKKSYFHDHDHDHDKVVYMKPHEIAYDSPAIGSFSAPGVSYGKAYSPGGNAYDESFPPGFSLDQPPLNAQISGAGGAFNGNPAPVYNSGPGQAYGANQGYGRSSNAGGNSIYQHIKTFIKMIHKLNITDTVLDDMNLKTDECKRKFVCEADFNAKRSIVLRSAFNILSDDSYFNYKTKQPITSLDECGRLYPNCLQDT